MNERLEKIARTLKSGDLFENDSFSEITITDFDNDFLALANGYKACGGDVYILQTLGLHSIQFDITERRADYDFYMWCLKVCRD